MRTFQILSAETREVIFEGQGEIAQDVYDNWLRSIGRYSSDDDADCVTGALDWLDDQAITMKAI